MKRLALAFLSFYKRAISPLLPNACRFAPTCSVYMSQAIERFGFWRGLYLGVRRLLRCHPFCKGGLDPVPENFAFRRKNLVTEKTADRVREEK